METPSNNAAQAQVAAENSLHSGIRVDEQARVIQDKGDAPFVVHSNVTGPIKELCFLRRALLFAELAMISYNDPEEATVAATMAGFPDVRFYDRDGAQAYRFRNRHDCVIACRGTEPHEWNDIKADANAVAVLGETVGRVHRGFKQEVDDLWPMLKEDLVSNTLPLWFCGHSLGGAMATISSGRCFLSHINSNPEQLFTFGSPRVGDKSYIHHVQLDHFRFVNNNDIVSRVPPVWLGYSHAGHEVYFNRYGRIAKLGYIFKRRDRWLGFFGGLLKWKIDHFADHSIHHYIHHILEALKSDEQQQAAGLPPAAYEDLTHLPPPADDGKLY